MSDAANRIAGPDARAAPDHVSQARACPGWWPARRAHGPIHCQHSCCSKLTCSVTTPTRLSFCISSSICSRSSRRPRPASLSTAARHAPPPPPGGFLSRHEQVANAPGPLRSAPSRWSCRAGAGSAPTASWDPETLPSRARLAAVDGRRSAAPRSKPAAVSATCVRSRGMPVRRMRARCRSVTCAHAASPSRTHLTDQHALDLGRRRARLLHCPRLV